MGESSSGFGGPNPIGGPSGAGHQDQPAQPPSPPPPSPTPSPSPQWSAPGDAQSTSWPEPGPPPQAQQWIQPGPDPWPGSGQQYGQQPGPAQYPQQQPWGPAGFTPAPRPKNRKPLYLALAAAGTAVVLVVAAVLLFGGSSSSGGGAESPSDAVQQYFEALARGDAQAALALGESQPPDTTFLTDDILKKQVQLSPIKDIKTLGETPGANGAVMVQVSVNMGGKTSSDKIPVSQVDGGWKVPHAAMTLDLGRNNGLEKAELFDFVTIFGEPAPKSGTAYVFPGPVEFGSSNPNISVTSNEFSTPGLMNIYLGLSQQMIRFGVSDDGKKAIVDAVMSKITECAKSRQLAPPDCPFGMEVSGLVDGTAEWTPPANLDGLTADFLDSQTGLVKFYGPASFGLRVQMDSGRPYDTTTTELINGEADVMKDPPTITYER